MRSNYGQSLVDFAKGRSSAVILSLDFLAMSISLSQFLLEFATTRTSRYGSDDDLFSAGANFNRKHTPNPPSPTLNASILSTFFLTYYTPYVSKCVPEDL